MISFETKIPTISKSTKKLLSKSQFEFGAKIGEGGLGHVFEAKDLKSGKTLAIKVMIKKELIEKEQVTHVENEKNLLERLDHTFIVKSRGFFQDSKFVYFAMEKIQCGELFDLLKDRYIITEPETCFFSSQIFSVLQHLHANKIIYRDLKPENIMLDSRGFIKVIDFGLGKVLEDDRTYTFCGTPQYMAPESCQGKGYGFAVDWWSFGIIIYEMIVGTTPFDDDDPMTVFKRILSTKPFYPKTMSSSAKNLIKGLLKKKTKERLGVTFGGATKIRDHAFFKGINFRDVLTKKIKCPVPEFAEGKKDSNLFSKSPSSNEDTDDEFEDILMLASTTKSISKREDPFSDW